VRSIKACGISNKLSDSEDSLFRSMPETEELCNSDDDTDNIDYHDDADILLFVLIARELGRHDSVIEF